MWWWGVCAGASCCSDVVHAKRAHVYEDLRPLMVERSSWLSRGYNLSAASTSPVATSSSTPPGLYTARNRMTHEIVALKVFDKKILARKDTRRRLRREVRVLSLCRDHPNLLTLYDVFTSRSTFEIAFELARGGEVMNRIHTASVAMPPKSPARAYKFSEYEISRVLAGVVDGLRFLHNREIIHGEVRPEHILYSDTEPDSRVLVADFGRAAAWNTGEFTFQSRVPATDEDDRPSSGGGGGGGKRSNRSKQQQKAPLFLWDDAHHRKFLPPFVVQRRDDTLCNWREARQVDIWALGVTMYVLLCACFPFEKHDNANDDGDNNTLVPRETSSPFHLEFPAGGATISRAARDLLQRLLASDDPDDVMTMDEVSMHPWIQDNCAATVSWSREVVESHRKFATQYAAEVAAVSRRRRVSDAAFNYSLRATQPTSAMEPLTPRQLLSGMNNNNHKSSSNSSSDERRDRYGANLDGSDSDSDSQHERPSFVSTSGNLPLLVAADEPPTPDGYMRMANAEIDACTRKNSTFNGDADAWHFDDDPVSPNPERRQQQQFDNDRRHRFQKQSSSVENKLWLVLLRQRRFFSFRSRSSSGSGEAGGSHSYQSDRSDSDIVVR
ncbi:Serine/threonine protein kinase, partial [Globisporangium splendens]